jgi:hypothetical protein
MTAYLIAGLSWARVSYAMRDIGTGFEPWPAARVAYHRVGKREFERSKGFCFAALVARWQLDWIRKPA